MAKAVGVATFAIYAPHIETLAWSHKTDTRHKAVHLRNKNPELFDQFKSQKDILKKNEFLYQHFEPALFKPELINFLNKI